MTRSFLEIGKAETPDDGLHMPMARARPFYLYVVEFLLSLCKTTNLTSIGTTRDPQTTCTTAKQSQWPYDISSKAYS